MYYARKENFMDKFDLNLVFQKYLAFSWEFKGKNKYFKFTVLSFVLSLAGYIFTQRIYCE